MLGEVGGWRHVMASLVLHLTLTLVPSLLNRVHSYSLSMFHAFKSCSEHDNASRYGRKRSNNKLQYRTNISIDLCPASACITPSNMLIEYPY
jgi:hypothetical protein